MDILYICVSSLWDVLRTLHQMMYREVCMQSKINGCLINLCGENLEKDTPLITEYIFCSITYKNNFHV